MVEVTVDYLLKVLGAKVVELEAMRDTVVQLEQQAQFRAQQQQMLDDENERLAGVIAASQQA